MQIFCRRFLMVATLFASLLLVREGEALTIDFDSLQHGEIVDMQFTPLGVTISALNVGGGPNLAIAFDSLQTGTADFDLQGPSWSGGNLPLSTTLGRLLIIAENDIDNDHDLLIDSPDDEGSRPAGSIFFAFEAPILSFGFDLIDVEGPEEYGVNRGFFAVFYDGDTELARTGFGEFVDTSSAFFVSGVAFGDNSANRIAPITAEALGLTHFDRVELNLGGSSAVDNIRFEPVPEPCSLALLGIGLAGIGFSRRRKRQ